MVIADISGLMATLHPLPRRGGLQFLPLVFCELHKGKSTALSLSSEYKPQVDTQPGYLADFRVRLH